MAAYAALVSLSNNMEQIRNHPRISTSLNAKQMESLLQRVDFLLDFIETNNSYGCSEEDLESQTASAAHAAEDIIESRVLDQILLNEEGSCFLEKKQIKKKVVGLLDTMQLRKSGLQRAIQHMDSIIEKAVKVKECKVDQLPNSSMAAASSRPGKINMVGFDGYFTQLLDELTGHQSDRKVIPIVGMGGIGKTTLARNAYDSLLVVQHFDVRAWVTVSQTHDLREILLETLFCLRQSNKEKSGHELGEQLHKSLSGWRYLIVLDDMWSVEAWDQMKFFFPDNHNRSRIVVTTRKYDVANHFGSMKFVLNFLDHDQSWKLFCEMVFLEEVCPLELEESRKKIVRRCKGLPLAIVVIAGLLGNSPRTKNHWDNVENNIRSILNESEGNRCLNLLSLSYSHLPACLKPCFLYFGIFPEDDVIRVSRLIKLWVAEGFIKPNKDQSLEEIAEGYVKDLVGRNLISVHSLKCNGKFKACSIHDLVRELCISIAEKEKFFCSTSALGTPQERQRRIVIREFESKSLTLRSKSLARSLISKGGDRLQAKPRLLRVLIEVYSETIDETFQLHNLRFLAHESRQVPVRRADTYHLPSSISLLWNVQTLIMTGEVEWVVAPPQIWEMPQLRHLKFNCISLPDPPPTDCTVLHNLQTLGCVQNFRCSEEPARECPTSRNSMFFMMIPQGKLDFVQPPNQNDLMQSLMFPSSLTKLSLNNCEVEWNDLTTVGSLPCLEVLKLKFYDNLSSWNPVEGQFLRLRYLKIERCKLISWDADNTHFPVLENLVLEGMHDLDEIPSGIGDIHTLQCISLVNCCYSVALSAVKILKEQESLGNQGLQLKILFWNKRGVERFVRLVEREGPTDISFQIEGCVDCAYPFEEPSETNLW